MAGDLEGEVGADFVGFFLKNLDTDLFGRSCWGGEDGEPLNDAEEGKRERVVEVEGDCGESVSFWGIGCEKGMNKQDL
jgi:hypothetical protein